MCGIAGIVEYSSNVDPEVIGKMIAAIRHRGPDDEGIFSLGRVGLGNCRLSILDLSPLGHMPMSDDEGILWITHNGEIYNYLELRKELELKGYRFRSKTDTEVILYSYKEWGTDCLKRFNGMWAFAIWDERKRTLFGARDRFGVKPFYYLNDKERFAFASEIKAFWSVFPVSRRLNDAMVYSFLADRVMDHLSPKTLFADIFEIPPAHWFEVREGSLKIERYWDIPVVLPKDKRPYNQGVVEEFASLLEDSVRLRLRADVPVGTMLSGGLDSSSVTCLAYRLLGGDQRCKSLHTFSALYPGAYDEGRYVEAVTAGTGIVVHRVEPSADEFFTVLNTMLWHQEAPFADASFFAQHFLMSMANRLGIKVLMSGQGGDEVLAGYSSTLHVYCGELFSSLKLYKLMALYAGGAHKLPSITANTLKQALPVAWKNVLRRHLQLSTQKWIDRGLIERYSGDWFQTSGRPPLDHHLQQCLVKYTLPTLLHHEDRNSMAFGVETRQPFLDYRLVELAFSTVDEAKINHGLLKAILRDAMKGTIPEIVRSRRDKIGFHVPIEKFLMIFRAFVMDVFSSSALRENPYLCQKEVLKIAAEFFGGKIDLMVSVWRSLIFAIWYETLHKSIGD